MSEPLKNLYSAQFLDMLANEINQEYLEFNVDDFFSQINACDWEGLELKQRVKFLSGVLHETLPQDFASAVEILKPVSAHFESFEYMVFPDFVATYGLDDFDTSMDALEVFTEFSTSEFAVRPFILKFGEQMMQQMFDWSRSQNRHLRRLASEGCRPRLPWACALKEFIKDPSPILPILENLKQDENESVRRSVANNLNDISKDHPELIREIAKNWFGQQPQTDRLLKHACRTLFKQGDSDILALFGYVPLQHIAVNNFHASNQVAVGDILEFSFAINSENAQGIGRYRIEYAIDFYRPGKKHSRKIFKLSEGDCPRFEKKIQKRHSFKPITTRKFYPGEHFLEIVINGKAYIRQSFELVCQ